MNFEEYNVLGNIINDGWGKSTEDSGGAFKIISKIISEERMSVTCMMVVNLLNRQDMKKESDKAYEQCKKICNEALKKIKKEFKTLAGRTLKTKELGHDESVELINMSTYSPKGTALVRCVYNFEVK